MNHLRGHPIRLVARFEWVFTDTGEPTVGNNRDCGHCGSPNTPEGHDGCLGTLPGVANACCGHGREDDAYLMLDDGTRLAGDVALSVMRAMGGRPWR